MATSTQQITTGQTSDATLRTNIINWKAGLEAVGLVQTSDTGQVNTATVTKPASGNQVAGYLIHRFNDSLQSGAGSLPVFIRTQFGTGSTSSQLSINVQIGTGTNGAGTLTGQVSAGFYYSFATAAAENYYFSGENGNRITVAGGLSNTTTNNLLLNIERLRDASGAATSGGITTLSSVYGYSSTTNKAQHQVLPPSGSIITQQWAPIWPEPAQSWAINNNLWFSPMFPLSLQLHQPTIGLLKYYNTDVTQNSTISIGVYGSTATYLALGPIYSSYISPSLNCGIAIRWQ